MQRYIFIIGLLLLGCFCSVSASARDYTIHYICAPDEKLDTYIETKKYDGLEDYLKQLVLSKHCSVKHVVQKKKYTRVAREKKYRKQKLNAIYDEVFDLEFGDITFQPIR